jgi:hypothetical protein
LSLPSASGSSILNIRIFFAQWQKSKDKEITEGEEKQSEQYLKNVEAKKKEVGEKVASKK